MPSAFFIVANTVRVRGRAAIEHLARNGTRAFAETAALHPRMRATLEVNPPGLPPWPYYVIAPRLPDAALTSAFVVARTLADAGPRYWERLVHSRINTPFARTDPASGSAYQVRGGGGAGGALPLDPPPPLAQVLLTLPAPGPGRDDEAHLTVFWCGGDAMGRGVGRSTNPPPLFARAPLQ